MAHCSASCTSCSEPLCHGRAAGEQHRARHLVLRLVYVFAFVLRHVHPRRVYRSICLYFSAYSEEFVISIRRQVFAIKSRTSTSRLPGPRHLHHCCFPLSSLSLSHAAGASGRAVPITAAGSAGLLLARRSSSRTASQHSFRISRWEAHPDFGAHTRF